LADSIWVPEPPAATFAFGVVGRFPGMELVEQFHKTEMARLSALRLRTKTGRSNEQDP